MINSILFFDNSSIVTEIAGQIMYQFKLYRWVKWNWPYIHGCKKKSNMKKLYVT